MTIKELIGKIFAKIVRFQVNRWKSSPIRTQERSMLRLINNAKNTVFGKDHHFDMIKDYDSFKKNIPVRDYEKFKLYVDRIIAGEPNVTWHNIPIYFCKSSGTTSGVKYLPITSDSMHNHIKSARNAILNYIDTSYAYDQVHIA